MIEPENYLLTPIQKKTINNIIELAGRSIKISQLWLLMDIIWEKYNCDQNKYCSDKYSLFYSHPIWLLNGMYIEQDPISISQRKGIAENIKNKLHKKILDYGGGFGTLAILIAQQSKELNINIYEPYPPESDTNKISNYKNICLTDKIDSTTYNAVTCIDVLEHLHNPINTLITIADSLKIGGEVYFANCFSPVILCHLPKTFHLRYTFRFVCFLIGLRYIEKCSGSHSHIYRKYSNKNVPNYILKIFISLSKLIYPLLNQSEKVLRYIYAIIKKY